MHDNVVLGFLVYHGYDPEYTPEDLAQDVGVELHPPEHPGEQHYESCPDGGLHLLVPARGPRRVFQENCWPWWPGQEE